MEHRCSACGAAVTRRGSTGPWPAYCSLTCQNRASYSRRKAAGTLNRPKRREPTPRICAECGGSFEGRRRDARFCSRQCRSKASRDSRTLTCSRPNCDRPVRAKGMCSKHWRRVARAEGREVCEPWTPERRARWKAREVLKRGATSVEPVVLEEIFDRDGWVCQICHVTVDRGLSYPNPMSKSLDHVVPLSKGGDHSPGNVQLAHLVCNLRKGASLAA